MYVKQWCSLRETLINHPSNDNNNKFAPPANQYRYTENLYVYRYSRSAANRIPMKNSGRNTVLLTEHSINYPSSVVILKVTID